MPGHFGQPPATPPAGAQPATPPPAGSACDPATCGTTRHPASSGCARGARTARPAGNTAAGQRTQVSQRPLQMKRACRIPAGSFTFRLSGWKFCSARNIRWRMSDFRLGQHLFANLLVLDFLAPRLGQSHRQHVFDAAGVVDRRRPRSGPASGPLPRSAGSPPAGSRACTPARLAARNFSLMPPTGSTLPLSVISPVIAGQRIASAYRSAAKPAPSPW